MSQSKFRPLAYLAVVALAAVLISAVVAVDVDAARGGAGGGGKGGKPGGSTATLTVSPNPATVGTTSIVISGSGFGANQALMVGPRGMIPTAFITADGSGAFSINYGGSFYTPGNYPVDARSTGSGTLLVTTMLIVQ